MKPGLKLSLGQSLTLTPQLRLAIKLLQMSAVELDVEIRSALESNPVLEMTEIDSEAKTSSESPAEAQGEQAQSDAGEFAAKTELTDTWDQPDHQAELTATDWPSNSGSSNHQGETSSWEERTAAELNLRDHLLWQANLGFHAERDRAIAAALIDGVDDDGYLRNPLEAVQQALLPEFNIDLDEINAIRHWLQRLEPLGVCSLDLADCLHVQLLALDDNTACRAIAIELVRSHLEALAKSSPQQLANMLSCTSAEITSAIDLIRSLNPKPGSALDSGPTEYIVPDAYAYKDDGRWMVKLNAGNQPALSISEHYTRMAAKSRGETANYLKGQLQEARWLIKSIEARSETMAKVAFCIVRQQSAFLEYGPIAMRPLTLKEVADEVGMHESTISRATTRKYLHTPKGVFEFKHFFSSGLATAEGGEASSTAIRAMIRALVDQENPQKPLSDSAMAKALNKEGIAVARRTVAKYRELLNIPASTERCRLS